VLLRKRERMAARAFCGSDELQTEESGREREYEEGRGRREKEVARGDESEAARA
jgi:hypothetical protein